MINNKKILIDILSVKEHNCTYINISMYSEYVNEIRLNVKVPSFWRVKILEIMINILLR